MFKNPTPDQEAWNKYESAEKDEHTICMGLSLDPNKTHPKDVGRRNMKYCSVCQYIYTKNYGKQYRTFNFNFFSKMKQNSMTERHTWAVYNWKSDSIWINLKPIYENHHADDKLIQQLMFIFSHEVMHRIIHYQENLVRSLLFDTPKVRSIYDDILGNPTHDNEYGRDKSLWGNKSLAVLFAEKSIREKEQMKKEDKEKYELRFLPMPMEKRRKL